MENKETKELLKLIQENTELPLAFMVDNELISDPYEFKYTFVKCYSAEIETIWIYEGSYYMNEADVYEAVQDDFIDEEKYSDLSDEEFDKMVDKYVKEDVEHYKAIVISL